MVHLEGFQELFKDFILSFLARLNIGMLTSIVLSPDVFNIKSSISTIVDLVEDLLDELCSELVHRANNNSNEFIKVDFPSSVIVESLEETINILFINVNLEVLNAFFELIGIKSTRSIIVHNLELASKAD